MLIDSKSLSNVYWKALSIVLFIIFPLSSIYPDHAIHSWKKISEKQISGKNICEWYCSGVPEGSGLGHKKTTNGYDICLKP